MNLAPIFLFAASSCLTPGPNNFMLMNSGLSFGARRSMPHFWGICFGFPAMVLLVALGLGAVFAKYVWLQSALKWAGAAYMLYLAWLIARASGTGSDDKQGRPMSFVEAAAFQWVNPKAWVMAVGVISIFHVSDNYLVNALMVSAIYWITCLPCTGVWLLFGEMLRKVLKDPVNRRRFNLLMAAGLVASIALIFMD